MAKKITTTRREFGIIAVVVLSCAALTWLAFATIHVTQERILTRGVDNFQFHRPLFGVQSAAQDIVVENELRGLGVILVNLRKAPQLADVLVTISEPTSAMVIERVTIPADAIHDDAFATLTLAQPITPVDYEKIRVTFTAPEATATEPVGIRFDPDDPYKPSARRQSGKQEIGDLALLLQERVGLGKYAYTTITQNVSFFRILAGIGLAITMTLVAARVGWHKQSAKRRQRIEIGILLGLAVLAFGLRLWWLPSFHGVSGGDPYNYLVITQQLSHFDNPFAISKRLPGFPLLLLPAYLTNVDDIWWERFISIVSASMSVFLIGLLARRLRLPWAAQLIAAGLLVGMKDFWWTSFRPEPYSFYGMLLLLALVLLFNLSSRWAKLLFGAVIGYAAMTRQEGFVLAATLGSLILIFWRQIFAMPYEPTIWKAYLPSGDEWKTLGKHIGLLFIPAFLLVLPWFMHNALTYGNPLYTEYFEGDRLQIVNSLPAFWDSLGATWGVLGSTWRPQWDELYRIPLTLPLFFAAALLTWLWWFIIHTAFYRRATSLRLALTVVWLALLGVVVWLASANRGLFYESVMVCSAAVLLASLLPFLAATKWRGVIVVAVAMSQILVALWFHPFAKHYQQVYPLLALALAAAIVPKVGKKFIKHTESAGAQLMLYISWVGLLTPLLLVPLFLWESQTTFIDKYNRAVALDNVVYRAARFALTQPGPHGTDQPYVPVHLYFSSDISYFLGDEPHTPAQALAWVREHNLKTLIDTNNNPAFKNPPPEWEVLKTFKAEGKDDFIYESRVYRIP